MNKELIISQKLITKLIRLYWMMRISIAFIWFWSAWVSWFMYPQSESLDWLRRLGLINHTEWWFKASCLLDVFFGMSTLLFPTRWMWLGQMIVVIFYSLVILIGLPEFLIHPFAPIIKNITILLCLYFLYIVETQKRWV